MTLDFPAGTRFVTGYSGGAGSWCASHRIAERYGVDAVTNVFTDVKGSDGNPHTGEDPDTYRFVTESSDLSGIELVWLRDGRDIWDVFLEKGWLGNASLSHCSWELKTIPIRRWLDENRDPADTVVVIGMDWTETHRHAAVHRNYAHNLDGCAKPRECSSLWNADGRVEGPGACKNVLETPWRVVMPMNERPKWAKPQVLDLMRRLGLRPPRLYELGFPHANCPACVKAGHGQWGKLLEVDPESFAYAERREAEFRASKESRANASILKDRTGKGPARPLTLTEFRERIEAQRVDTLDLEFDWGGCGCAVETKPAEVTP